MVSFLSERARQEVSGREHEEAVVCLMISTLN